MSYFRDTLRNINWPMLVSLVVLLTFSVIFVGSAAYNIEEGGFSQFIGKQCVWIMISLLCFLGAMKFNYRTFHDNAYQLYAGGLVILIVLLLVPTSRSTHSWIRFGPFSFQPSELVKIFYVFVMAHYLQDWHKKGRLQDLIIPILLSILPFGLIMLQPDLGTAIIFIPVMFIMLFMAGVRMRYLTIMALILILAGPTMLLISDVLKKTTGRGLIGEYQKERITAFLDPEEERLGVSYQSYQSLAAIGSGRFFGRGIGNGIKTQFDHLPAKHTDFIISVIAEEGGFVGVSIVLGAFYVFLITAIATAHQAPDNFGKLVVIGIIGIISTQVLINIGVASALLPVTGITLPFISYGGSSMMASFIAIGVVMSVGREKKAYFA